MPQLTAPLSEDNISIYIYKGQDGVDSIINTNQNPLVEVGDFVVVTSDHAPVPAGAYVTTISSGASVTLSEAISGTVPSGATELKPAFSIAITSV